MEPTERTDQAPRIEVRVGKRVIRTPRTDLEAYEAAFVMERSRAEAHDRLGDSVGGRYPIASVLQLVEHDGLAMAFLARILQGRYVAPTAGSSTTAPPSLDERLGDLL